MSNKKIGYAIGAGICGFASIVSFVAVCQHDSALGIVVLCMSGFLTGYNLAGLWGSK